MAPIRLRALSHVSSRRRQVTPGGGSETRSDAGAGHAGLEFVGPVHDDMRVGGRYVAELLDHDEVTVGSEPSARGERHGQVRATIRVPAKPDSGTVAGPGRT